MSDDLLHVERLTTVFRLADGRDVAAVNDVSFSIKRGETLGLVGESGSGKSITALSIVGLVPPPGRTTAGRVLLHGRNLLQLDDDEMCHVRGRKIGFVFQEPMVALNPVYTIGAQLRETLAVHGLARGRAAAARTLELLDAVSIPDPRRRATAYPHQLSGGLRQRAMIALAIAAEPVLLIADEPTTALDVTVQGEILDLLRDMREKLSLSLLLITHDLAVVAETTDHMAVMYGGRIVEYARTPDLLAHPAHPYSRALLDSIPGIHAGPRLRAIPGTVPSLGGLPPGCAFSPRCEHRMVACADVPPNVAVAAEHDVRCFLHGGRG